MQGSADRNVSGTKRAVGVFIVVALSAAVALFAFGRCHREECGGGVQREREGRGDRYLDVPDRALRRHADIGSADGPRGRRPDSQILAEWRQCVRHHLEPSRGRHGLGAGEGVRSPL